MHTTLISVAQLQSTSAVIIDCSADLAKPEAGRQQFEEQHIANALFADIHTDLATHDTALAINGGRHPLPSREHFAKGWAVAASANTPRWWFMTDKA